MNIITQENVIYRTCAVKTENILSAEGDLNSTPNLLAEKQGDYESSLGDLAKKDAELKACENKLAEQEAKLKSSEKDREYLIDIISEFKQQLILAGEAEVMVNYHCLVDCITNFVWLFYSLLEWQTELKT
jgi:hypothetical protein